MLYLIFRDDSNKIWGLQMTIRMKSQLVTKLMKHKIHNKINLKSSKTLLLITRIMTLIRLMKMVQPKLMMLHQLMLKRLIRVAQKMPPVAVVTTITKGKMQAINLARRQPLIQMMLKQLGLHRLKINLRKITPHKTNPLKTKQLKTLRKISLRLLKPKLISLRLPKPKLISPRLLRIITQ